MNAIRIEYEIIQDYIPASGTTDGQRGVLTEYPPPPEVEKSAKYPPLGSARRTPPLGFWPREAMELIKIIDGYKFLVAVTQH